MIANRQHVSSTLLRLGDHLLEDLSSPGRGPSEESEFRIGDPQDGLTYGKSP